MREGVTIADAEVARGRIREAVPTLFQPPSPRETQTEIFA